MTLSILHRATGVAMAFGFAVLAAWLVSAAAGAAEYERFTSLMGTPVGQLLLIGWTFAFFYHLANGVRHLFWDAGHGFEKHQANASAWFVLVISIAVTAIFWLVLV
jgi:succinate dehydrogenase / fumarate reductase cytochrome b subunit